MVAQPFSPPRRDLGRYHRLSSAEYLLGGIRSTNLALELLSRSVLLVSGEATGC